LTSISNKKEPLLIDVDFIVHASDGFLVNLGDTRNSVNPQFLLVFILPIVLLGIPIAPARNLIGLLAVNQCLHLLKHCPNSNCGFLPALLNLVSKVESGTLATMKGGSRGALGWSSGTALKVEYHWLAAIVGSI
jgi:hypothetical protein